jgi:hypothetical protein
MLMCGDTSILPSTLLSIEVAGFCLVCLLEVHKDRAKTAVLRRRTLEGLGEESDGDFRKRIMNRGDPIWVNEHDVEAAFQKVLSA